jgi:uncharacterized protein
MPMRTMRVQRLAAPQRALRNYKVPLQWEGGVIFEWNEQKRRANRRKHGLDFADCARFFAGPIATAADDRFAYRELRLRAVGVLYRRVVVVVYTEADDIIRIISMRKATRREEAQYFKRLQD